MTAEEIRAEVESIKQGSGDNEVAHGREDELHQKVLRLIADGAENAAELAREALKTLDIDYARWYA